MLRLEKNAGPFFTGLAGEETVWMSHGDSVSVPPAGFTVLARSDSALAAIADISRKLYLVQFHPEVKHTANGRQMLRNFLFTIASLNKDWDMSSFIEATLREIKETVGDKQVVYGISGGVDSSVMAVLLHKALGDRLRSISWTTASCARMNGCRWNAASATTSGCSRDGRRSDSFLGGWPGHQSREKRGSSATNSSTFFSGSG